MEGGSTVVGVCDHVSTGNGDDNLQDEPNGDDTVIHTNHHSQEKIKQDANESKDTSNKDDDEQDENLSCCIII